MTNSDTLDKIATLEQIRLLESVGCDIVRITVPNIEAVNTIPFLRENGVTIPIVADIHFDYKIAVECASAGVDKIRINPGNIGEDDRVKAVCDACRERHIPIRIGVNSGSLEKQILAKHGAPTPAALCESALYHISLLERFGFYDTLVSIKASTVTDMIAANRLLASKCDYPLHLGVTEAGTSNGGIIKSSIGLGTLLAEGIGNTMRVSLTADPVNEIYAAKDILKVLGMRKQGAELVSCPTCGRTQIDMIPIATEMEQRLKNINKDIKVAVMGCAVNGPGEAREADIGVAGGKGEGLIFKKGVVIKKVPETEIISTLMEGIERL
jgi:(E)-4-hydroxy-3-methylbut-2-enyl-diphosphate synthase